MKKNLALRLGITVLVLSIISISLVTGTFAKYTLAADDSEIVRAAKFAFNLTNDGNTFDQTQTDTAVFNIFDYVDTGVYNNGVIDVDDEVIAPGTTGSFAVDVESLSEVDITVAFALTETNANDIPVYYTIGADTQRYSSVLTGDYGGGTYGDLDDLAAALTGTKIEATDGVDASDPVTFTLNWTWAFNPAGGEQTDVLDTQLGVAGTATVELECDVTVTQVDAD